VFTLLSAQDLSDSNFPEPALFPTSFRGELAQYLARQQAQGTTYLFESNRYRPYSTRRLRQLVKHYALAAGITKRVYPHLFRH
jgi:integrase/recombinase XerD